MREAGIAYKRSAGCLGPHRHAAPSPASPTPSRPWPCTPRRLAVARRVGGPSRPRETVVWRTRSPQSAYGTMHKAPSTHTRCVCRHIVAIRSVSVSWFQLLFQRRFQRFQRRERCRLRTTPTFVRARRPLSLSPSKKPWSSCTHARLRPRNCCSTRASSPGRGRSRLRSRSRSCRRHPRSRQSCLCSRQECQP
jgi:hypothetical protein